MMRLLPLTTLLTLGVLLVSCLSLWHGLGPVFGQPWTASDLEVLRALRLPRLMAALASGALLGLAGTAVQAFFRNPLAEPGLVGVSAGAALAAAAALSVASALPVVAGCAFLGGLAALGVIRRLAGRGSRARLILAGVAVNALLTSLLILLMTTLPDSALRTVTFWLLGSFAGAGWPEAATLALAVPLTGFALGGLWRFLNALQTGEASAFHLGFAVDRLGRRLMIWVAVAVGLVVAQCGSVSFVGLMAPHLARQLVGSELRRLLLTAPLMGALLTVLADWVARAAFAPAELPVGAITSLAGAPFFLWLLARRDRRQTDA
ncbi:ABC-type Fe3+-siderophore transport system, permease component [Gulbenkiania indica]|uniref:ABC-type Fe3+-siderophore transport system, permease component n=1 Tax=Gulbenkiania indica TaxID=375574 RepID=A0A0K6GUS2_9NEIS|nr:iron ABC transporter permease [Gulbenkiania indica]CUA82338.1 ABC-type Fe3+-siderophore transport system, permease component [Gulbenkiania indica]